ncbi:MAG: DUF4292 domain-containing protein [Ignavibacteria bacterium]|nr:DUF4292 domain-containing protein [Ignavibacteria bacterium]
MKYNLAVLFISCLIFYSCTASDTKTVSEMSFEELKAKVNENSMKLKTLDADGEISIDSPDISNSGSITVSINKPDSVFTKLEGPFGMDIADLLITRDNFIYYKPQDNTVIKGPSSSYYLGIIMKIKIEFDDIVNAFSGKFIFNDDQYEDVKISMEKGNYLISLKKGDEIRKFWINAEDYYVTKIVNSEMNGDTKIEILYENFYERDGIHFPKNITITRPKEKQNIWLTYSRKNSITTSLPTV